MKWYTIALKKEDNLGYLFNTRTNKKVINEGFINIIETGALTSISDYVVIQCQNHKYKIYNVKNGKQVSRYEYDKIYTNTGMIAGHSDYFIGKVDGILYVMNKKGKTIFKASDFFEEIKNDGLFLGKSEYFIVIDKNKYFHIFSSNGKEITHQGWKDIKSDGLVAGTSDYYVCSDNNGYSYVYDSKGNKILSHGYEHISSYGAISDESDYIVVRDMKTKLSIIFDKFNNKIIDDVEYINYGGGFLRNENIEYAVVVKDEKSIIIDKKGNKVLPINFDYISMMHGFFNGDSAYFKCKYNNSLQIFDIYGKKITTELDIEEIYEDCGLIKGESNYYICKINSLYYIFDKDGNKITPNGFDKIDRLGIVSNDGEWYRGYMNNEWRLYNKENKDMFGKGFLNIKNHVVEDSINFFVMNLPDSTSVSCDGVVYENLPVASSVSFLSKRLFMLKVDSTYILYQDGIEKLRADKIEMVGEVITVRLDKTVMVYSKDFDLLLKKEGIEEVLPYGRAISYTPYFLIRNVAGLMFIVNMNGDIVSDKNGHNFIVPFGCLVDEGDFYVFCDADEINPSNFVMREIEE